MIFNLLLKETLLLAFARTAAGIAFTYIVQWSMQHIGQSGLVQETVYRWWPIAGGIAVTGSMLGMLAPALRPYVRR